MKLILVITITLALISNTFGSKRSQNCNCQDEIEDLRKENTDRQIEIGLLREQDIEINTKSAHAIIERETHSPSCFWCVHIRNGAQQ